jgi:hypothetical protein
MKPGFITLVQFTSTIVRVWPQYTGFPAAVRGEYQIIEGHKVILTRLKRPNEIWVNYTGSVCFYHGACLDRTITSFGCPEATISYDSE